MSVLSDKVGSQIEKEKEDRSGQDGKIAVAEYTSQGVYWRMEATR